jgi:gamma-glutamyltranspeptidase
VSLGARVDSAALCAKVPVSLLISGLGSDGFSLVHHHKQGAAHRICARHVEFSMHQRVFTYN